MSSSSPTSPGAKGSVLLVEEYGALAAAIRAALKKFAPSHAVTRVRSLSAALTAARGKPPDFLILDFDPPFAGVLDFFSLLREISPSARVLIIAANLPQKILHDERLPTAFSFVEKPFQLAELGAAITYLLASSDSASETSARTALEAMSLADIIPLLGIESLTGTVGVTAAEGALVGELAFDRGTIPTAAASGLQGIDALREMLRWPSPEFDFTEGGSDAPRRIEGKWPRVLEQVARSIPRPLPKHAVVRRGGKKSTKATRAAPAATPVVKDGKKILIIDDTETLRIFVDEMLSESDPHLRIVSAPDGAEGIKQCAALQPDLILLDYSLPDFNGDEVCRRLLDDDATRGIPVIMMSGHVAAMGDAEARYENIVLTLSKPFVSAVLIEAVTKTLAKPPERRRRKAPPANGKPQPRAAKPEHKTNSHTPAPPPATPPEAPATSLPEPATSPQPSATTGTPSPESASEPAPASAPFSAEPPSLQSSPSSFAPALAPDPAAAALLPVTETAPDSWLTPEPLPTPPAHIPAHIAVASTDAVVVSIDLEVVSMQFSPTLRITSLRARPSSAAVLLHVDPRAISAVTFPEVAFEISRAQLDDHGQLRTLKIVPTTHRPVARAFHPRVSVERLAILPSNGRSGLQITPTAAAHMTIRLLAAFDLAGVELSPSFGVSYFILRVRSGRMRVVLPGYRGSSGGIFETKEISLNSTGRIAEVELRIAPALGTQPPPLSAGVVPLDSAPPLHRLG